MKDKNNKKKNYEVVKGNISDLELSPVSEHITPAKPKKKNQSNNIVIPQNTQQNTKI